MGSCAIGAGRNGRWKLEDGRPKTEVRRWKTAVGRSESEVRRWKTEDRRPGLSVSLKLTRSEQRNFKRDA